MRDAVGQRRLEQAAAVAFRLLLQEGVEARGDAVFGRHAAEVLVGPDALGFRQRELAEQEEIPMEHHSPETADELQAEKHTHIAQADGSPDGEDDPLDVALEDEPDTDEPDVVEPEPDVATPKTPADAQSENEAEAEVAEETVEPS